MKRYSISTKQLFLLSLVSVVLLMVVSDFSPQGTSDFQALDGNSERIRAVCAVIDSEMTENGWILTLQDTSGVSVRGFCKSNIAPPTLPRGTVLDILAEVVCDPDPFLFIESIEVL